MQVPVSAAALTRRGALVRLRAAVGLAWVGGANGDMTGLIALGVSGPLVLSFIVFLCSFVPVVGVFISTLPMAVAALGDYGMSKVLHEG